MKKMDVRLLSKEKVEISVDSFSHILIVTYITTQNDILVSRARLLLPMPKPSTTELLRL
jgi:hypothetical protein